MTKRGSFGPVVLLGLASAALAAVAGNKPLLALPKSAVEWLSEDTPVAVHRPADLLEVFPLSGALALLLLASWGVILVTGRGFRRAFAVIAAASAAALLVTSVYVLSPLGRYSAGDSIGARIGHGDGDDLWSRVEGTGWGWTLPVVSLLAMAAALLAVRLAPHWPEMGSKYDAPSADGRPAAVPLEEQSSVDLWKALDAGHDPTRDPEDPEDPQA